MIAIWLERRIFTLNIKKFRARVCAVLALSLAAVPFASAEPVFNSKDAKIYQYPNASSASLTLPAGTLMEKTAQRGDWVRVERAGRTAFMRADAVEAVVDCGGIAGYTTEAAPMYKRYGDLDTHGTLPAGTEVKVVALAGNWAWVHFRGYKGFVQKRALSPKAPETAAPDAAQDDELIVTGVMDVYAAREGARVYKSASDSSKLLGQLPLNTKLELGAMRGGWGFVRLNGFYGFMKLSELSNKRIDAPVPDDVDPADEAGDKPSFSDDVPESANDAESSAAPVRGTAKSMDWWTSGIQDIFARGVTATITDVATGISWKEIRKGGTNHADVQPLTAEDTAAMKAACGEWSWTRRAIFVTIDGVNYAASMNCMPHGSGSINNNNFDGHHCIHFTNSRTHGSNKVDALHQTAIQKALSAKL